MKPWILGVILLGALSQNAWSTEEKASFGRFGTITLYHQTPEPSHVVLFVSGDGGWNEGVVDMARDLESFDALVVGIDITHYLKELESSGEKCSYPASDFEELSKFVQGKLEYPSYVPPVLVGYSSGATLVYAALVQAPANTFRGAMSLGFCPDLPLSKPFCPGNGLQWGPGPKGKGVNFLPAKTLEVPWIALQGLIDQVCDPAGTVEFVKQTTNARIIELPKVGHGYSVPKNWLPQFRQAFLSIAQSPPVDQPVKVDALADLPLTEIPAAGSSGHALAVHVTGDGGFGATDKGLSRALADQMIPVVAFNSLHYFWKKRTPEDASEDLARVLRHYLAEWKKDQIVLIGYSLGADVLPFMINRLPSDLQSKITLAVLLGPSAQVDFQFHLTDWLGSSASKNALQVQPEIEKMSVPKIYCFSGASDSDAICRKLDPARVTSFDISGGHRIGGRFQEIADKILQALP